MKLQCENLMLSDVEKGNNLMLTRLTPVATLKAAQMSELKAHHCMTLEQPGSCAVRVSYWQINCHCKN